MGEKTKGVHQIIYELQLNRRFDFSGYRIAMLERRIQKRIDDTHTINTINYLEFLRNNKNEWDNLIDVLTINVSQFLLNTNSKNQNVLFYVKDTGIGITKSRLHSIFNMFEQVEDLKTRMYGGAGIGLSVAKRLTHLLGGEIWVESQPTVGSQFYFTLPVN